MTTSPDKHSKNDLHESELDAALARSKADVAAGRYVIESPEEHMARLEAMLVAESDSLKTVAAFRGAGKADGVAGLLADRKYDTTRE